ncbi:MAG: TRAP transporter small permease subunit [Beijerinckiaceae bacterium]|nr:TRAP transporter small permease subunit [Beijerinckiaceae bacterium]MCZ8300301.1 TRAP transporter small permease subunit [Beijerinckiaceae bacterium]
MSAAIPLPAQRLEAAASRLDRVVELAGRFGAWTGFALIVVMGTNVLMRYLFRTGSVALQELEWHLMAPVSLLCIAFAIKHEGHIRVDILYARFSPFWKAVVELVSAMLALLLSLLIVWLSVPYVYQSFSIGEGSPDPGGLPYRFIVKSMIPLGFVLLALQSTAWLMRASIPLLVPRDRQA